MAADMRMRHAFQDGALQRDVTVVCLDVLRICESLIHRPPALGSKPIIVQKASDDLPRAVINGLPNEYIVNLTCLDTRDYCRITYQLAHELGHHYVDPHRSGWFIESTVTALSLTVLSEMGEKWTVTPPFANWKSWAHNFPEYRDMTERTMLEQIHLKVDEAQISAWLKAEAPALLQKGAFDRPHQHACAIVIAAAFRRHPKSWGAIALLGNATSEAGQTDFAKWELLAATEERPLVKELAKIFGPLSASQNLK